MPLETQVRTPQLVFMQPQRLTVPLFQRPYVWNRENQWEPLWNDVARVAARYLAAPTERHNPHFLGAVVLQQVHRPTGLMQQRTIIDGQQRLTTLQLLLDALHAELLYAGATGPARRLEPLVLNDAPFCATPEDQFKVWPTNRDRPAFNAVMNAHPPVDHDSVGHPGERMVEAHRFFCHQARAWLVGAGAEQVPHRALALETTVRDLLQMVVIDLGADENAQEIFETLNARGAQLTAADLIKNLVFQRLLESGADVEQAYEQHWKEFETGFWETEVSTGRLRYPRSSMFLNHWLVARTGDEVVAREVFARFKRYADFDSGTPMGTLLSHVHRASQVYRDFVRKAEDRVAVDRVALFGYRTSVLESEVLKPLVLRLLDPELPAIPTVQLHAALDAVESWMVRRMLVRATSKSYTQVVAELVTALAPAVRAHAGEIVRDYFAGQQSDSRYWPDDDEVRDEVSRLPAYRRLSRGRLRMVLEAIEDYRRGWVGDRTGLGGQRVARGLYAIEHIMPRKWQSHWPANAGVEGGTERDALIHTIGNLTLLTNRLNAKVSNGPWVGESGKRAALEQHDVLVLNRELLKASADAWTDDHIRLRTAELLECILAIWPVPAGHRSGRGREQARPSTMRAQLVDLITAGLLEAGAPLFRKPKEYATPVATVLPDGRVDVSGTIYASPSDAASAIAGHRSNGWTFFVVDKATKRSLRRIRHEYLERLSEDGSDTDEDGDEDDA